MNSKCKRELRRGQSKSSTDQADEQKKRSWSAVEVLFYISEKWGVFIFSPQIAQMNAEVFRKNASLIA